MWTLRSPPTNDVIAELNAGLNIEGSGEPTYTPTVAEQNALLAIYSRYDELFGRRHDDLIGSDQPQAFRDAVFVAYGQVQDKRRLQGLRDSLKIRARECPYCGFGQIQHLDHHLGKAKYQLLSIYPRNLIPACATCNQKKPRLEPPDANRDLLNPYLSQLPTAQFLVAEVEVLAPPGGLRVQFDIDMCDGMSEELRHRLRNHLDVYELNSRFDRQVNIYLGEMEVALDEAFGEGDADYLSDFLGRCADSNARRFGVNDWRTALMRGLAGNAAFCSGAYKRVLGVPEVGA